MTDHRGRGSTKKKQKGEGPLILLWLGDNVCNFEHCLSVCKMKGMQFAIDMILFIINLIAGVYIFLLLYVYYYGMMDHSGVKMDALWPWQPPSMFHDNHHKWVNSSVVLNMSTSIWMFKNALTNKKKFKGNWQFQLPLVCNSFIYNKRYWTPVQSEKKTYSALWILSITHQIEIW